MSHMKSVAKQARAFGTLNRTNAPFGIKYGPGGRSSNNGITATVFGGTGFVGRYLLNELGSCGTRAYVPYRGCELEPRVIKPMFDIGQLGLMPFSTRDKDSIRASLDKSDVVINLIGKHYETKHFVPTRRADGNLSRVNFSFEEVNVTIPETIAELSKECGVKCLIHMSALSADVNSTSKWSRTKALGEQAVRAKFPEAIIVKPAPVFGAEDRLLNWIAETISRAGYFPLLNGGRNVIQPVYSNDIAKAILEIIYGYVDFQGKDFQLVGPNEYSYKEIAEFVADVTLLKTKLVEVSPIAAKLAGSILGEFINPVLSVDSVEQMMVDVVAKNDPNLLGFKDLDIVPQSMDKLAFDYLSRFRVGGHFTLVQGYH